MTITGLTPSTSYDISVSTLYSTGYSEMAIPVTITTDDAAEIVSEFAIPTDLVEVSKTDTEISVSWTPVPETEGVDYIIHYKVSTDEEWID